ARGNGAATGHLYSLTLMPRVKCSFLRHQGRSGHGSAGAAHGRPIAENAGPHILTAKPHPRGRGELCMRTDRNALARAGLELALGTPNTRFSTPPMNRPRPAPAMTSKGKCAPRYTRDRQTATARAQGRTFHQLLK